MNEAPKMVNVGTISNSPSLPNGGPAQRLRLALTSPGRMLFLALACAGLKENYGLHPSAILAWMTLKRSWNEDPSIMLANRRR